MRVGTAVSARNHPASPRPMHEVYAEILDDAVLAEQLGFSSWRLGAHHFAVDQHNATQFSLLGVAADRTSHLRLGPYVLQLALHDPVKVAEEVVALDLLSRGRVELAVGAGVPAVEARPFGVDPEHAFGRTYEALEVLTRCLAGESFSHEGRWLTYDEVHLTTLPMQARIPILVAAMGPQSATKAGQRGYGLASVGHTKFHDRYLNALFASGRHRDEVQMLSGPLPVHVAPSRDQAWDEAEAGLWWMVEFYRRRGITIALPPMGELRSTPGAGLYGVPFVVGTPDDVTRGLSVYGALPMDELIVQFRHPGMASPMVHSSMRLFAEHVLPELRGLRRRPADS